MTPDRPWEGDAVSLVEAFRAGERSPVEELQATFAAIDASALNAVCHVDRDAAVATAEAADVHLPFGGVPMGIKERHQIVGWPDRDGSLVFADEIADHTDTMLTRLFDAGAVAAAQTTSSEFGGTNQTTTRLHGATRNPWNLERTPGGSSGGSAAGVAGGLFTVATGGDGGGSIRIPAGFTGSVGLKGTFGRIPRGPFVGPGNLTVVPGCQARSVRDTARFFDVCNGFEGTDPLSLPPVSGWERALGSFTDGLRGRRVAVVPEFAGAVVADEVIEAVEDLAAWLIGEAGLDRVDDAPAVPRGGGPWSVTGGVGIARKLGDRWPDCADDLTGIERVGAAWMAENYDVRAAARAEDARIEINQAMAALFDTVDLVISATNPAVAFDAEGRLPSTFGGKQARPINNGALTIPSNIYGNPAISVPAGQGADGLPVGVQILAPHFQEQLLLDLALRVERGRPWPLLAPGSPH